MYIPKKFIENKHNQEHAQHKINVKNGELKNNNYNIKFESMLQDDSVCMSVGIGKWSSSITLL